MSSAGAVPIKTKLSTAAVGRAEAEIQAKQANGKDLKNIDIDSQHLNYEISSIPRESWWKTEEKDVNNDLSHSMSVFPNKYIITIQPNLWTTPQMNSFYPKEIRQNCMLPFYIERWDSILFIKMIDDDEKTPCRTMYLVVDS